MASRRTVLAVLLTMAALLGVTWLGRRAFWAWARRPNVLLVGIDTLRADRLGCYGYQRPTSPTLDAIAAESVIFETAISQSPWTLPAFGSIFTGLLPHRHGAGRGKGFGCDYMPGTHPMMATLLRAAGYRTASFVTNGWVSREVGMARGFDPADSLLWPDSQTTMGAALKWLRAHHTEQFFLFVHIDDPHAPYVPSADDIAALGRTVDTQAAARINGVAVFERPLGELVPGDRAVLSDLYDAEVHQADRHVARLWETLRELDLLDDTILIIVSDHGEELLEHGEVGHGHTVYDELLRVPLLLRFPGGRWATRVREQVRTMDLLPTVLEALELPVPEGLDGQTLWPLVRHDADPGAQRLAPAEFLWRGNELKALRRPDAKLVLTTSTGELRWYDLAGDPGERSPIVGLRGAAAALRQDMERIFASFLDGLRLIAFGSNVPHDVRVVLRTGSRFDEATLMGAEGRERLLLSADRRRVKATLRLYASPWPPAGVDVDSVRVRTADNASVSATVVMDGRPLDPAKVRLGMAGRLPGTTQPWRLAPNDPAIVVPSGYAPKRDPDILLAVTSQGLVKAPQAPMSEQTRKSLRALGYVE